MTDREAQIAVLDERIKQLTGKLEEMRSDVAEMKLMTERYRGAFLVVAAIGSIIGIVVQLWTSVTWHPHVG